MTLRLDPRRPLVWRDPATLQIGIDPPRVVLERVTDVEERLIAALGVGVTRSGLDVVAGDRADLVGPLLDRLVPALEAGPRRCASRVVVAGSGIVADLVVRLLASSGVAVVVTSARGHADVAADAPPAPAAQADPTSSATPTEEPPTDLAVIVARGVVAPGVRAHWLRRDTPHLAVVTTDAAVTIGPVIDPGHGPCLLCLERHRRDADPAWPAIATQLLTQPPVDPPAPLAAEAAARIVRRVLDRLGSRGSRDGRVESARSTEIRIGARGDIAKREVARHPDCGCAELDVRQPAAARALSERGEEAAGLSTASRA